MTHGRAVAEAVSRWLPTAAVPVRARVWQVGYMVDKVASGQVFSEYFGFPCQYRSFHQLLHHHDHPGQLAESLRRADHPSKESCNRNETESFMEAAKAQNWAVEPQEKNSYILAFVMTTLPMVDEYSYLRRAYFFILQGGSMFLRSTGTHNSKRTLSYHREHITNLHRSEVSVSTKYMYI
jgi:hypothetical protein